MFLDFNMLMMIWENIWLEFVCYTKKWVSTSDIRIGYIIIQAARGFFHHKILND